MLLNEAGSTAARGLPARRVLFVAGFVLIALNLRPTLTAVAPLLNAIREHFGMDASTAGLLTMLPVACLGVFGAVAARLARRFGTESVVLAFVLMIACGSLLRGTGSQAALFLGTAFGGAGIGVVGVLLPALVKRDFGAQAGGMMGVFTMVLVAGAAAGAGASIPLAEALGGWQPALMAWAAPALLAALVWVPQVVAHRFTPRDDAPPPNLWRDPLAWRVTFFMGLQSSLAYMAMGWLPVILEDFGMTAERAGFVSAVSIACQMVTALTLPPIAARARDQRLVLAFAVLIGTAGTAGIFFGPGFLIWPSAVLVGLSLGGCFGVALTLIVLRTRDGRTAAQLSAMSQSVGYLLASLGPLALGMLHDASGGWSVPGVFFIAVSIAALIVGLGAARPRYVGE
ncbi:CynX/NimT family MFS transporter [Lutibaculum baratangense]|uniref:Major facilitator superfamily (MFS) profile domain-containing protein n=1 Tax=Lutibaculum baratangense AMV1 TaxID=631454 RepID=V4RJU7_9HYPH|nr:CynX/NimT family MFS transporter [Lutibaculum baratangense]ESR26361.1 hypothetical protein N177_0861 [Lutibaculum baratangense AMV1]